MTYTLYGRAGWGSTIVEAQLVWYELPFKFEPLGDLFKSPEARAKLEKVNPLAQVPTLVLPDGSVMSESAAITLLLADITGDDSLVPGPGAPGARFAISCAIPELGSVTRPPDSILVTMGAPSVTSQAANRRAAFGCGAPSGTMMCNGITGT